VPSLRVDLENSWLDRYASLVRFLWRRGGYKGFFVYGEQGSGKTTLALHLLRKIYGGNWEEALRHTFFTPQELQAALNRVIERVTADPRPTNRLPAVLIDDAGVFFSAYKFFEDVSFTHNVQKFMQLARRATACTIFTATEPREVLRPIRQQRWLYFSMERSLWHGSIQVTLVNIYTLKSLPDGRRIVRKLAENMPFAVWLPDTVRERYVKMQALYLKQAGIDLSHSKSNKGKRSRPAD